MPLDDYLKNIDMKDINCLFKDLNYCRKFNLKGPLNVYSLILLDEEVKEIAKKKHINSYFQVWNQFHRAYYDNKESKFLENEIVKKKWEEVTKLAFLDKIFKDEKIIESYQGSYIVFQYIKRYLEELEKEDITDIYQDFDLKYQIILNNIKDIVNYLISYINSTNHETIIFGNNILTRLLKDGENLSDEKIFISSLALGSTLDIIKDNNYEYAKSLIFIPNKEKGL